MGNPRHFDAPRGPRLNKPLLTPQQRQIAPLLVRGLRNAEIAEQLGIQLGTLKCAVSAMYKRVGATGRFAFIFWYRQLPVEWTGETFPVPGPDSAVATGAFE